MREEKSLPPDHGRWPPSMAEIKEKSLPTDDERSTTCSIIPRSNISDREIEISEWLLFAVSE